MLLYSFLYPVGLKAAKAAGMKCCVTQSVYSRGEDFASADVVVDDLDHGTDGPITMTYLNCKSSFQFRF